MDAYSSGVPTNASLSQWPMLHAYRVLVTPEMAAAWLSSANVDNRTLRKVVVQRYAALMRDGQWKPTHQGVAFSHRRLIDGQHRLSAVVASGRAQWMVVFVEQDDDVFGVLDRGTARGLRDEIRLDKHIVDAVAFLSKLKGSNGITTAVNIQTSRRILDVMHPYLTDMASVVNNKAKHRGVAAIRAAVALRLAEATKDQKDYLLRQWRAWMLFDVADMSPTVVAGLKRLDNISTLTNTQLSLERAAIGWITFNPQNTELSRILVRNVTTEIREMQAAFQRVMDRAA